MKGNLSKRKEGIYQMLSLEGKIRNKTQWLVGGPFLTQPTWQHEHAALTHKF